MDRPATENPRLMSEPVTKYMDGAMLDPELYAFAITRDIESPPDIDQRDKSRQTDRRGSRWDRAKLLANT